MFAGTKTGVFISSDGAQHWIITPLHEEVESLLIDSLGTVFAGTEDKGLWASFDDGASWQQVTSIPKAKVMGLALSKGILYVAVNDYGMPKSFISF